MNNFKFQKLPLSFFYTIFIIVTALGILSLLKTPITTSQTPSHGSILLTINSSENTLEAFDELVITPIEKNIDSIKEIKTFETTLEDKEAEILIRPKLHSNLVLLSFKIEQDLKNLQKNNNTDFDFHLENVSENNSPVWQFQIIPRHSDLDISKVALEIENEFSRIDCIQNIEFSGKLKEYIQIKPKFEALVMYDINPNDLITQIQQNNTSITIDNIHLDSANYQININNSFSNIDNLRNSVIKTGDGHILLNTVADVMYVQDNSNKHTRYSDNQTILDFINVQFQSHENCNIFETNNEISKSWNVLKSTFGNFEITQIENSANQISRHIITLSVILIVIFILAALFFDFKTRNIYFLANFISFCLYISFLGIFFQNISSTNIDIFIFMSLFIYILVQRIHTNLPKILPWFAYITLITLICCTTSWFISLSVFYYSLLICSATLISFLAMIFSIYYEESKQNAKNTDAFLKKTLISTFLISILYFLILAPSFQDLQNSVPYLVKYLNTFIFIILAFVLIRYIYNLRFSTNKSNVSSEHKFLKLFTALSTNLNKRGSQILSKIIHSKTQVRLAIYIFTLTLILATILGLTTQSYKNLNNRNSFLYINLYQNNNLDNAKFREKVEQMIELILQLPEVDYVDYYEGFEILNNTNLKTNQSAVVLKYSYNNKSQIKRSKAQVQTELQKILDQDESITALTDTSNANRFHLSLISSTINDFEQIHDELIKTIQERENLRLINTDSEPNKINTIIISASPFELSKRGITNQQIGEWLKTIASKQHIGFINSSQQHNLVPIYLGFEDIVPLSKLSEFVVHGPEGSYSISEIATLSLEEKKTKIEKINGEYIQSFEIVSSKPLKLWDFMNLRSDIQHIGANNSASIDFEIDEEQKLEDQTRDFFTFGILLFVCSGTIFIIFTKKISYILPFLLISWSSVIVIWLCLPLVQDSTLIYFALIQICIFTMYLLYSDQENISELSKTSQNFIQNIQNNLFNSFNIFFLFSLLLILSILYTIFFNKSYEDSIHLLIPVLSLSIIIYMLILPLGLLKRHFQKI